MFSLLKIMKLQHKLVLRSIYGILYTASADLAKSLFRFKMTETYFLILLPNSSTVVHHELFEQFCQHFRRIQIFGFLNYRNKAARAAFESVIFRGLYVFEKVFLKKNL